MDEEFGGRLRACRERAHLSLRDLACKVHYNAAYISKIERGLRQPSPSFVDAIDAVLSTGSVWPALATQSPAEIPVLALASPASHIQEGVIAVAARRASKFLAGHTEVDRAAMDQLHDDVQEIARAYPQVPVTELLPNLTQTQDVLFRLLERRQRPEVGRQLYFLAGVTSGLMAKASHDYANPHAAATQARTAWLCADRADHPGLRGWIRGLQSLVAYWNGRNRDALRYAQQGAQEQAHGTVAVWLASSEARGWAALGNESEATAAIQRAEDMWEHVEHDELDELGGICAFGRSRQAYYAGEALSLVDPQAASFYADNAVAAYADPDNPEWSFGDQAGAHASLAIARIATGQIDGAVEALGPVLDFPTEQRINGIIVSTRRVHDALRRAGHGRSDLAEAIEDFTLTPLTSASL